MRTFATIAIFLLCGCAGSVQSGGASTQATVLDDFEACDRDSTGDGIDAQIERCSRALNSNLMPEDPTATALIRRGNLYAFKGEYDRSKQDYDRALALKPMARFIRGNRAAVEFVRGDDTAAFADYAAAVGSGEWHALIERGTAWRRRGALEKAIADFTSAYRQISSDARILVNRGLTYVAHGDYALALADLDKALKLEPDFLPRELAKLKAQDGPGDLNRVVPGYSRNVVLMPEYFLLERARGFALFMSGHPEEAVTALNAYLSSQPQDVTGAIMMRLASERVFSSILDIDQPAVSEQSWPEPVIQYLKGKATIADVLKAAGADPQRQCSANFYFGEAALTASRKDDAKINFQRAVSVCPRGAFEGSAAAFELKRL